MRCAELHGRPEDVAEFAALSDPGAVAAAPAAAPRRIDINPDDVERGLSQLVLSVIELVRRLVEKQALRRIEGGSLDPEQIERVGVTLFRLQAQMEELKRRLDIDDLNIDLGPLGRLLDD